MARIIEHLGGKRGSHFPILPQSKEAVSDRQRRLRVTRIHEQDACSSNPYLGRLNGSELHRHFQIIASAEDGLEPPLPGPKPVVLPLDDSAPAAILTSDSKPGFRARTHSVFRVPRWCPRFHRKKAADFLTFPSHFRLASSHDRMSVWGIYVLLVPRSAWGHHQRQNPG